MTTPAIDLAGAADLIAAVRADLGMSQAAFSALTGRSTNTIWRYEHGRARPPEIFFHDLIEAAPEAGLRFNAIAGVLGYRRIESVEPARFGSIHDYFLGVRVHSGRSRATFAATLRVSPDLIAAIEHRVKPDPDLVRRMVRCFVEPAFGYADVVRRFRTLRPSAIDHDLRDRFRRLRDPATQPQHVRHLRDELVRDNADRARRLARREVRRLVRPPDAEDVWPIALFRAVDGHNPRYGDFIPYLRKCIFGQVRTEAAASWQTGTTGMLRNTVGTVGAVCRARDQLRQRLHREPRPSEVAAHLQLPTASVNEALRALEARHPASLDTDWASQRENDACGARSAGPAFSAEVMQWLSLLDGDSRTVLVLHFEQDLDATAIAEHLGVDLDAAQAALSQALVKLRQLVMDIDGEGSVRPAMAAALGWWTSAARRLCPARTQAA